MHFITDQEFRYIYFNQLRRSVALLLQVLLYEENLFYEIQSLPPGVNPIAVDKYIYL